jgi:hypothetical protein
VLSEGGRTERSLGWNHRLVEQGELHETRSETGLTVIVIEAESLDPAIRAALAPSAHVLGTRPNPHFVRRSKWTSLSLPPITTNPTRVNPFWRGARARLNRRLAARGGSAFRQLAYAGNRQRVARH